MGLFDWFKKKNPNERSAKRLQDILAELGRLPEEGELTRDVIDSMYTQTTVIVEASGIFLETLRIGMEVDAAEVKTLITQLAEDWVLSLNDYESDIINGIAEVLGDGHRSVTLMREVVTVCRQILDQRMLERAQPPAG
ncbi:MAG: hypothetical protein O7B99_06455 [Planctomycetota bacterium]|nr:hypothetical protein [Planctomycetota bacterium]